jgi:hypothetical protein
MGWMSTNEEKRNTYMFLVGKLVGRRLLGRPKHRWVDNVKLDLEEIVWGVGNWIDLVQDRDKWRAFAYIVLNLLVQYNAGRLSSGYTTGRHSSSVLIHLVS